MNLFHELVEELDDGDLTKRLGEEVQAVVRSVRRTKLAGEITLRLSFKPDGRTVVVTPKVSTKIPTEQSNTTTFFDLEDGNLTRSDPKQLPLINATRRASTVPLRAVAATTKEDE